MSLDSAERSTTRIAAIGLAVVTVGVLTQSVTDPVNVTKLFLLGGFAFGAFGAISRSITFSFLRTRKAAALALGFFILASVSSLMFSSAPFTQSLYGVYGRNNGFLLYFLLALLFTSTLFLTTRTYFNRLLVALATAGIVNVAYALWVLAFGDFMGWSNPYGNLLGTLGNPNFIGSFFGMFAALLFSILLAPNCSSKIRIGSLILIPLVFLGIVQTNAVQGKVLFMTGFAIASFYWIRDRFKTSIISISYLAILSTGFLVGLMGTLQKGPLVALLYKESVSLRGEYWYAGWKTGMSNPVFGAGFDSLGDWYRRSRRDSALNLPGVDTVTNASHNVFLDMFAFGGWPLFLSYLALVTLVIISIIKFTLRNRRFDPIFVSLTAVWLCYQLQSLISINQIGLAIWGWAFGGAIIAYEKISSIKVGAKDSLETRKVGIEKRVNQSRSSNVLSPDLVAALAAIVGLIVAVPPLSSDMTWRKAQISQSAKLIEETLLPAYLNPINTHKINFIVGVFETNGLTDLAHEYGLKAVELNVDNYEAWRNLFQLSKSTDKDRATALENMRRLDPLNPNPGRLNN